MNQTRKKILNSKKASRKLAMFKSAEKNRLLQQIIVEVKKNINEITAANSKDLSLAKKNHLKETLVDRLSYGRERIESSLKDMQNIITLEDPVGKVFNKRKLPNDLIIYKKRVPLGVIGVIYEARPNVALDVISLTLKTGNTVLLKGSRTAYYTNKKLVAIVQKALKKSGADPAIVQMIDPLDPEAATEVLQASGLVDVIIPRGSQNLINFVRNKAKVPVIETGIGVCHIYVDKTADLDKAKKIIYNAKVQRPSVCNAMETLLVEQEIAKKFLPIVANELSRVQVELRCDKLSFEILKNLKKLKLKKAHKNDFGHEFLDLILSIKVVKNLDEAIEHIQEYGSGHSESIISQDEKDIQRFFQEIEAAVLYSNASTRFTDGGQFGLGAEMGISTQKLHVRGPIGLEELTSYKWLAEGSGQIRE